MKRSDKRGVSLGTVVMLLFTTCVLMAYALLVPAITGNQDIRLDAAQLAVAIDESFSQLAASTGEFLTQQSASEKQKTLPSYLPAKASATPVPAPATPPPKLRFSFCAAGSILLNNKVQQALTVDNSYRFDILTDQLAGKMKADLSIATLENTVINSTKLSNLNMPTQLLSALRSTGINALSLSHPNALNNGVSGLQETAKAMKDVRLLPYGMNTSHSSVSSKLMLNGVKVVLLSYQDSLSTAGIKQTTEEERSAAYREPDQEVIIADIAQAKASGANVIVVSLCWGKIGAATPTDDQRALAQAIADAGADMIIGTHSGVLQPVQVLTANRGDHKYHPVLCAYSLGNLMTHDREKRANLASILLKTDVVFDTATGCVAFEQMQYTPTYAWRGKDDGKTRYRVLLNDGITYPDFVDKDQKGVMSRCFTLVNDIMADTGIPMSK